MRLLNYDTHGNLQITRDLADDIPPYAILSHTWGADEEEVTYGEVLHEESRKKIGYKKIEFCGQQAQKDGLTHFWVDTCCIDKANYTELSEAITSMFRWYQQAKWCYVYLSDVSGSREERKGDQAPDTWEDSFRKSRWFTRGWTLQELLAPTNVAFFSKEGACLGTKATLKDVLYDITTLPIDALCGQPLLQFTYKERLRWTKGRQTKKKEDEAYCLMGIFDVYMPLIYGEGDRAFIRLVEEITKKSKVIFTTRIAEGATFDACDQVHQSCHPDTRVELLQNIHKWTRDENGRSIFWLNGMAGTGKSTIAWTVANSIASWGARGPVALGGSFFFKRGEAGDRGSAALLFPTLAYQLAQRIPGLDVLLAQVVNETPDITSKALGKQFTELIRKPLQQIFSRVTHLTYIIVIDALDECDVKHIGVVLRLWSDLPRFAHNRLRLLLTSRPEIPVLAGFDEIAETVCINVRLQDVPQQVVTKDIATFLRSEMADIRQRYNRRRPRPSIPLDDDWPGETKIRQLTDMATPLFIVAATICLFVGDRNFEPAQRLSLFLSSQSSLCQRMIGHLSQMARTYLPVLKQIAADVSEPSDQNGVHNEFRTVVGSIVALAEPLSRAALSILLDVPLDTIRIRLSDLHSVLAIPDDDVEVVRLLHVSFGEYLTSPDLRQEPFGVNPMVTHQMLGKRCLQVLSAEKGLKEDICGLNNPGQLRAYVDPEVVRRCLPSELRYACRYWVYHICMSESRLQDYVEIYLFLRKHFIHWLEALSLLGRFDDVIVFIQNLRSISVMRDSDVFQFLDDAYCFVLANRYIGKLAPLQLYSAAIIFVPRQSLIRNICGRRPAWITQTPSTATSWSLELPKLKGYTSSVVASSLDDSSLALASRVDTVWEWESRTGVQVQVLGLTECIDEAITTTFSPDGSFLASTSRDGIVRLWQVSTGRQVQQLKGHTFRISIVIFSSNSSLLATVSRDRIVRVWQVLTGQQIQQLEEDKGVVSAVAFSPNCSLLASASRNGTIRVWRVSTGQQVRHFEGHTDEVTALAFSPNNFLLASASWDKTMRLWRVLTGRQVQQFDGHTSAVTSVVFSPNSSLLASASWDQTVQVWRALTGQHVQQLRGHSSAVNIATFSPDSSLLASASWETIRVWRISTGQQVQHLEGCGYTRKLAFAADGRSLYTDRGFFSILSPSSHRQNQDTGSSALTLRDAWVECGGDPILWLPPEYRNAVTNVFEDRIAFGYRDGQVRFLQIQYNNSARKRDQIE